MIVDLPSTTTAAVNRRLVELREKGGAVALGRVLTLVIVTDDGDEAEESIRAANDASREHPCRVVVIARGAKRASARLDAQIRVGGDAGASEVLVLRLYGPLADQGASVVIPLLLPDAPVVAWWPGTPPSVPSQDPVGRLAQRRITDAATQRQPGRALAARRRSYADGDTDLAWTRITPWRALSARLRVPIRRVAGEPGSGITGVELTRRSGPVTLVRPDGVTGTLSQPGQPDRRVALQRRAVRDCIAEELRRLDADEIYRDALDGLLTLDGARSASPRPRSPSRKGAP